MATVLSHDLARAMGEIRPDIVAGNLADTYRGDDARGCSGLLTDRVSWVFVDTVPEDAQGAFADAYGPVAVCHRVAGPDDPTPKGPDTFCRVTPEAIARAASDLIDDGTRATAVNLAVSYLGRRGYRVLERDWVCAAGTVDIVAVDPEGALVLMSIRHRVAPGATDHEQLGTVAVEAEERRAMRKCCLHRLVEEREGGDQPWESTRFDVLGLTFTGGPDVRLRHLVGAVSWDSD